MRNWSTRHADPCIGRVTVRYSIIKTDARANTETVIASYKTFRGAQMRWRRLYYGDGDTPGDRTVWVRDNETFRCVMTV